MSIHDDDNHVDFSDLPTLPSEQIRVLGHVIRNPNISFSELIVSLAEASDGDPIEANELKQILKKLINQHLLSATESDGHDNGETTYRPRMRRKTSQVKTIQGIWKALDGDEDLDANIDSEIRRVRSDLANSMLADMSKEHEYEFNAPPPDPEKAKQTGQSLLSDLMSAGRSSMSKRDGLQPPPVTKPESRMQALLGDIAEKKSKTHPAQVGNGDEDEDDEKNE